MISYFEDRKSNNEQENKNELLLCHNKESLQQAKGEEV